MFSFVQTIRKFETRNSQNRIRCNAFWCRCTTI